MHGQRTLRVCELAPIHSDVPVDNGRRPSRPSSSPTTRPSCATGSRAALEAAGHRATTVRDARTSCCRRFATQNATDRSHRARSAAAAGAAASTLVRALRRDRRVQRPRSSSSAAPSRTPTRFASCRRSASPATSTNTRAVQHIVPALAPHLFPEHYNRRSSPRVVLGIPVSYRVGNTIATALTLNISHGGLAIRTTSPLDVGTIVKVRFRLPGAAQGHRRRSARRVGRSPRRHGAAVHRSRCPPTRPADRRLRPQRISSRTAKRRRGPAKAGTTSASAISGRRHRARNSRSAFATTITDAPVSASTAIHSVAVPVTAITRNAAFSTSDTATFVLTLRSVARASRIA